MNGSSGCGSDYRRSSLPSPLTAMDAYPHESAASNRRRSSSISRVRDNFRRTSVCIQHKVQAKLLQLSDHRCDPGAEGGCGLIYHVPNLPGDHTRESVVEVLNQSMKWLQENPDRRSLQYNQPPSYESFQTLPDLLDQEMECVKSSIPPTSQSTSSSCESLADPVSLGILTKDTCVSSSINVRQNSCPPTPVEFYSQGKPYENCTSPVPPMPMRSVTPYSSSPSPSPSPSPPPPAPMSPPTLKDETMEAETIAGGRDDVNTSLDRAIPPSLRPAASKMHVNPDCVQPSSRLVTAPLPSPTNHLGSGLRPVIQPTATLTPTLVLTPAPPAMARRSREVLDRQNRDGQGQGRFNHSSDDRGSRQLKFRGSTDLTASAIKLQTIEEQVVDEFHIPSSNSVAEMVSRFEKPLPSQPPQVAEPNIRQLKKRPSFFGSLFKNQSQQHEESLKASKTPEPLSECQPCPQAPIMPIDTNEFLPQSAPRSRRNPMLQVTREYPASSPGNHSRRNSLTQYYDSHLPYVPYSQSLSDSSSLQRISGRVDQMRRQFEDKDDNGTLTTPTRSKADRDQGMTRTPRYQSDPEKTTRLNVQRTHTNSSITHHDRPCSSSSSSTKVLETSTDTSDKPRDNARSSWDWKRFVDRDWDQREREQRPNTLKKERRASKVMK